LLGAFLGRVVRSAWISLDINGLKRVFEIDVHEGDISHALVVVI
jgi:hypothetical protein